MTSAEQLAAFTTRATADHLSGGACLQLKIRILDAIGCAIGALDSPLAARLRAHTAELDGQGQPPTSQDSEKE